VEGIHAILAAMKEFPADQAVIENGFRALANIVDENKANADLLVTKLGGLPFLIERMKAFVFQDDADITKFACDMLKSLSDFEDLRNPIVNAKAITALAYAIERHGDEPSVQEYARKAIKKLV
jgi:hypothetical protein